MIATTPIGAGREPQLALSRVSFIAAAILVAAMSGTARGAPGGETAVSALASSLALNKSLWLCLGIAVWHLHRQVTPRVAPADLVLAFPALALAGTAAGVWPWIGLALSLLLWLPRLPDGAVRVGLLLALATATQEVSICILGELAGDTLLNIDARIAALLSPLLMPALAVSGTALHSGDGHTLILVWGCSSLSNLGESLLLCWALTSLHPCAVAPGGALRLAGWLGLLGVLVIALNAARLTLMASSMDAYRFVHDEGGAVLFRIVVLALTATISGVCIHDASRRFARTR